MDSVSKLRYLGYRFDVSLPVNVTYKWLRVFTNRFIQILARVWCNAKTVHRMIFDRRKVNADDNLMSLTGIVVWGSSLACKRKSFLVELHFWHRCGWWCLHRNHQTDHQISTKITSERSAYHSPRKQIKFRLSFVVVWTVVIVNAECELVSVFEQYNFGLYKCKQGVLRDPIVKRWTRYVS